MSLREEFASLNDSLDDRYLHLVVFGPGFGESLGLRSPGGEWLVVDSFAAPPAAEPLLPLAELLEHRGEKARFLLLTHPHEDHAQGFDRLLERLQASRVGCLGPLVKPDPAWTQSQNLAAQLRKAGIEAAYSAIEAYWEVDEATRWEPTPGNPETLGPATIDTLHPTPARLRTLLRQRSTEPNQLSIALRVTWEATRVVLGADLPSTEWGQLERASPAFHEHAGLKVPHHGSGNAQHRSVLGSKQAGDIRIWVVTPFDCAGHRIPSIDRGGEVSTLLDIRAELHQTSSPSLRQGPGHRRMMLEEARQNRLTTTLPDGEERPKRRAVQADRAWTSVAFRSSGELHSVSYGPEAITFIAA